MKKNRTLFITGGALAAGLLVAGLAFAGGSEPAPPAPNPPPVPPPPGPDPSPEPTNDAEDMIRILAVRWGIDDPIRDFLIAMASHESGLIPRAMLGVVPASAPAGVYVPANRSASQRAAEAAAAAEAYDRNVDSLGLCAPRADYVGGSYGLFAFLPANGVDAWTGTVHECVSPFELFAVGPAVIAALGYIARVQDPAYGGDRTLGSLRMSWLAPTLADEWKDAKWKPRITKFDQTMSGLGPYRSTTVVARVPNDRGRFAELLTDWLSWQGPIQ